MELLSGLRFLSSVLCEKEVRVVNYRNRADCKAMCCLMGRFCQVVI